MIGMCWSRRGEKKSSDGMELRRDWFPCATLFWRYFYNRSYVYKICYFKKVWRNEESQNLKFPFTSGTVSLTLLVYAEFVFRSNFKNNFLLYSLLNISYTLNYGFIVRSLDDSINFCIHGLQNLFKETMAVPIFNLNLPVLGSL